MLSIFLYSVLCMIFSAFHPFWKSGDWPSVVCVFVGVWSLWWWWAWWAWGWGVVVGGWGLGVCGGQAILTAIPCFKNRDAWNVISRKTTEKMMYNIYSCFLVQTGIFQDNYAITNAEHIVLEKNKLDVSSQCWGHDSLCWYMLIFI